MPLIVNAAAEATYAAIITPLRIARRDAKLSLSALGKNLSVRGNTISGWEHGAVAPTLDHLLLWVNELGQQLVIAGRDGTLCPMYAEYRPGETWERFERRCLADPLRARRRHLGWSQTKLGKRVGVSRDSIQRWELAHVPPHPIAHVVWAQQLGYTLVLRPIGASETRR